jgi:hypothetical protein
VKMLLASLGASAVIACGEEPDVNAILYVEPPTGGGNCVGVAGFKVRVSQAGQADQTADLVDSDPILDPTVCALPGPPFIIQDLDLDSPVTVTIEGYDGTGQNKRVSAAKTITSLQEGPVRLPLTSLMSSQSSLLVFDRGLILQGTPLSAVKTMVVSTQKQPEPLLSVIRDGAGVFFGPEPGAYETGLRPNGLDSDVTLTVDFPETTIPRGRLTTQWNSNGYYYAKP